MQYLSELHIVIIFIRRDSLYHISCHIIFLTTIILASVVSYIKIQQEIIAYLCSGSFLLLRPVRKIERYVMLIHNNLINHKTFL